MVQNIFKGIKAYASALGLISTLGLWKYFAVPVLISFITASLIGLSAWSWSDNIANTIDLLWMWEWGADWFHGFAEILGGILIIILGFNCLQTHCNGFKRSFYEPCLYSNRASLFGRKAHP